MGNLRNEGHRVLIFSMSKKMLTIIESYLESGIFDKLYPLKPTADEQMMQGTQSAQKSIKKRGKGQQDKVKYMRIDGNTEIGMREQMCIDFNKDRSMFCALLTTKVGGFGLNLTGADRAIILDPDWNPANDNQAVDRVFRIGQKRDVIVYRLVTMGTIEEKIYRRQIYKKGMNLATIDGDANKQANFEKYFGNTDLFELFEFQAEVDASKGTLGMLLQRDGCEYVQTKTNNRHIDGFLKQLDLVKGITMNTQLYTNKEGDLSEKKLEIMEDEDMDIDKIMNQHQGNGGMPNSTSETGLHRPAEA